MALGSPLADPNSDSWFSLHYPKVAHYTSRVEWIVPALFTGKHPSKNHPYIPTTHRVPLSTEPT